MAVFFRNWAELAALRAYVERSSIFRSSARTPDPDDETKAAQCSANIFPKRAAYDLGPGIRRDERARV
jgi:hypothetical protein